MPHPPHPKSPRLDPPPQPTLLDGCLLLVACLLAAAKPCRSTLDTKKGYKTKTGSTSSVTLALTLALALTLG